MAEFLVSLLGLCLVTNPLACHLHGSLILYPITSAKQQLPLTCVCLGYWNANNNRLLWKFQETKRKALASITRWCLGVFCCFFWGLRGFFLCGFFVFFWVFVCSWFRLFGFNFYFVSFSFSKKKKDILSLPNCPDVLLPSLSTPCPSGFPTVVCCPTYSLDICVSAKDTCVHWVLKSCEPLFCTKRKVQALCCTFRHSPSNANSRENGSLWNVNGFLWVSFSCLQLNLIEAQMCGAGGLHCDSLSWGFLLAG